MAAVRWGITIPFREDPDPTVNRTALLNTVRSHLANIAPIELVDSDPTKPFNRAGARNNAVRYAEQQRWEVVVVLDADTLPPLDLILPTVKAAKAGGIHQPFRYCVTLDPSTRLTPETLNKQHLGRPTAQRLWVSPGSCYILRPDVYWNAGGQDEGFINWGGEDSAFIAAARALNIPIIRHPTEQRRPTPGTVAVQLHHGDATDRRRHPTYPATKRRQAIYDALKRDPKRMRQWIAERYNINAEEKWNATPPNARSAAARSRPGSGQSTSAPDPTATYAVSRSTTKPIETIRCL